MVSESLVEYRNENQDYNQINESLKGDYNKEIKNIMDDAKEDENAEQKIREFAAKVFRKKAETTQKPQKDKVMDYMKEKMDFEEVIKFVKESAKSKFRGRAYARKGRIYWKDIGDLKLKSQSPVGPGGRGATSGK
ncbi:MAG: hypothetical protein ACOC1O_00630 [bacterium]